MVKASTERERGDTDGRGERAARQRDQTRQRLMAAAIARFREHGYGATTTASIAADAGVTERTFFRHFATKADVLVANWEQHADALRAVLSESGGRDLFDTVRAGLGAFASEVRQEIGDALDTVVGVFSDRAAFLAIVHTVLDVENDLAALIAERTGLDENDFAVRSVANASLGVFRASLRSAVAAADMGRFEPQVDEGLGQLRPLFDELG